MQNQDNRNYVKNQLTYDPGRFLSGVYIALTVRIRR